MCNTTSLSHFLEGVNFMDEQEMAHMTDFQLEDEFFGEDGNLLMLDMDIDMEDVEDCVLDTSASALELPKETLPPLELANANEDLDALLSPPAPAPPMPSPPTPTTSTGSAAPAPPGLVHQTSLEKLAHCMRHSEMSLKEKQGNFMKLPASHSTSPVLMKANPFFTGSRVTITPELEQSRQQLWSFVRQQQQFINSYSTGTHHQPPFTAAA